MVGNITLHDYRILTPVGLRAVYSTLTDTLIHRIELLLAERSDLHVVFLDKSARPVCWLVRALWPMLARVAGTEWGDGCVPIAPTMSFANIDREQWWDFTGASETDVVDVDRVPHRVVAGLRGAYLTNCPPEGTDPLRYFELPSFLDGRLILVVDEVSNTGDTLKIAAGLTRRAFPDARVETAHWMSPGTVVDPRSGQRRTANVPVWYRDDAATGRLVGDRYVNGRGRSWRGTIGRDFLSTVPLQRDKAGLQLRREAGWIAQDLQARRLLAAPSLQRDDEDFDARVKGMYGYTDMQAFTKARSDQAAKA